MYINLFFNKNNIELHSIVILLNECISFFSEMIVLLGHIGLI